NELNTLPILALYEMRLRKRFRSDGKISLLLASKRHSSMALSFMAPYSKYPIVVQLLLHVLLLSPTVSAANERTPEETNAAPSNSVRQSTQMLQTGSAHQIPTSASVRTTTRPTAQTTTAILVTPNNCTRPTRVANQFGISGLSGWDLTSHADYFNNSASEHEHNLNCQWIIAGRDGLITLIRITNLILESSPTCDYDALIFDFVDLKTDYSSSQNFCGSVESKVLLSASGINITFKTDSSYSRCTKPEEMRAITIAGISAPGERLVSHEGFSMEYAGLVHLEYLASTGGSQLCNYDNLTLHFTDVSTGQPVRRTLCAMTRDRTFLANSSIEVTFRTDSSVSSRGFAIEWMHLNETQAELFRQSWEANTTQSRCMVPMPLSNLTLNSAGPFSGGQLMSHVEYLTIVNSSYQPNMNCNWTIRVPDNFTLIHFRIVSLDLETSSVRTSECRFDNVTFVYKNVITDRWASKVACKSLHLSYFTSKSDVVVKFVTDRSVSRRGFHLRWYFVPLHDAYELPGLEDMQWPCCLSSTKILSASGSGLRGGIQKHCLCKNSTNGFDFVAYPGSVTIRLRNRISLPNRKITIFCTTLPEPVHTNCSSVQRINKYQSKISDRLTRLKRINCEWTIRPLDENHAVKVKVIQLESRGRLYHLGLRNRWRRATAMFSSPLLPPLPGSADCSCMMQVSTAKGFYLNIISNWTEAIHSDAPVNSDSRGTSNIEFRRCCGRDQRYFTPAHSILHPDFLDLSNEVLSLGPVSIKLNMSRQPLHEVIYEIDVQHFPVALPGSSRLCSGPPSISKNHDIVDERNGSRLVSLKQSTLTSKTDCISSVQLTSSQSLQTQEDGHGIRLSVNCTDNSGHINVVKNDLTVTRMQCDNGSFLFSLLKRVPVTLEAVGTGGFTAVLELVSVALEVEHFCSRYTPTSDPWTANLLLYTRLPLGFAGLHLRFCRINMTTKPGHDLIVRLQMPFSNDYHETFCSEVGLLHYKPKLSFILSAPHTSNQMKLNLCNQDLPGGLQPQDKIRVSEGESLTIDVTMATMSNLLTTFDHMPEPGDDDFGSYAQGKTIDAFLTANQVEVCSRIDNSIEQWQLSADGTQLLTTVTVAPDNTQTDCKIQLDAFTAARIADCWKLEVKLDKFSTVCGLKQLMLTASHWDSLAASVEHMQREVCGSDSQFEFRVEASLQAEGSGMSLAYSEVRSGFRARFSISGCGQSSAQSEQLVESPANSSFVSPALTALLVILALCNLLVVLYIFRAKIIRFAASRSQRSRQLIYQTGTDGVNLINEDD
uniref:Cubilin n=1 Tax=Macrostomum lignano TaxID=282301 RepID=A0A1I8HCJ6_9PLAT